MSNRSISCLLSLIHNTGHIFYLCAPYHVRNNLCILSCVNNSVFSVFADKIGPVGRWLRHMLLDAIVVGTPVLVAVQVHV